MEHTSLTWKIMKNVLPEELTLEKIEQFESDQLGTIPSIRILVYPYTAGELSFYEIDMMEDNELMNEQLRCLRNKLLFNLVSTEASEFDVESILKDRIDKLKSNLIEKYINHNKMSQTLFDIVKSAGKTIKPRTDVSIMLSLVREVGELAEEVAVANDLTYKKGDVDGVTGEAIDLIITALDMIHKHNPNFTDADIIKYGTTKVEKWVRKSKEKEALGL